MRGLGIVALGIGMATGCAVDDVVLAEDTSEITHGVLDNEDHPAVVMVVMEVDATTSYRCSGTLLSPTVVLTAGHCTSNWPEPEYKRVWVIAGSDLRAIDHRDSANGILAASFAAHPLYSTGPFYLHDVGVITLSAPIEIDGVYPTLPAVNALDDLRPRRQTTFTAVGYGLQRVNAAQVTAEKIRMRANPYLVQINTGFTGPQSLVLSNNAATGGTCFGDSGGPNFIGSSNEVGGVTSFGLNGSCGGTGGVFRVDRPDVLAFIHDNTDL